MNLSPYVFYAMSGGDKKARSTKEALMEIVREEHHLGKCQPTMIIGDFNAEPDQADVARQHLEEQGWSDIGKTLRGGEVKVGK